MNGISYHIFQTDLGWIGLLGGPKGIRRLSLRVTPQEALDQLGDLLEQATPDPGGFIDVQGRLARYFQGEASALDGIPLDLSGAPPFFAAAWAACRQIPPGETRSYGWLAAQAGNPRASRAAGQAMARNRLVLVVPCHRVIGGDGSLHGYGAGGLEVKARLLALERSCAIGAANPPPNTIS